MQWSLPCLLECLYPTVDPHKRKSKLQSVMEDVRATHLKLWPDIIVPSIRAVDADMDGTFSSTMPTSLAIAVLVWGWCASKRSLASRLLSADILAALISTACQHSRGLPVEFMAMEADQTGTQRLQVVDSSCVINCWTTSMSDMIALAWDMRRTIWVRTARKKTCSPSSARRPVMRSAVPSRMREEISGSPNQPGAGQEVATETETRQQLPDCWTT